MHEYEDGCEMEPRRSKQVCPEDVQSQKHQQSNDWGISLAFIEFEVGGDSDQDTTSESALCGEERAH